MHSQLLKLKWELVALCRLSMIYMPLSLSHQLQYGKGVKVWVISMVAAMPHLHLQIASFSVDVYLKLAVQSEFIYLV